MNTLWNNISHHWLSIVLVIGALYAIWLVYKNKEKLFMGRNDNK